MAAFKQLNSQDILISPLEVNKNFTFKGDSELSASNVDINRFLGRNINYTASNNISTGFNSNSLILSQSSVYDSVKELYYSNYLTSSFGDSLKTSSVILGSEPSGDVLVGPTDSGGRYFNYLQSTLTQSRSFPTNPNNYVLAFSVPSKLYGDYIQPNSFVLNLNNDGADWTIDAEITDDGNGNLISGSVVCGQIFYPHGIAVLTQQDWGGVLSINDAYPSSNITCSF